MLSRESKLLILGSSGHAAVILDVIELVGHFTVVGVLDDTVTPGTVRRGYPVLGGLQDIVKISSQHQVNNAAIAIGDNWLRRKMCRDVSRECPDLTFPVVQHPSATLARSAQIADGAVILAGAHVGPGTRIGSFCIVNTCSSLDHDCALGNFASLAPGVFTGGNVTIGECSAIGVGASISHRISIGDHSVVGTGAAVVRDIPDLVVAYGNPAKIRRSRKEGESYL